MAFELVERIVEAESSKTSISVKCRGKRLFELIPNFNDSQRSALRRIGFGGMLELKFKNFPLEYIPLFLDAFKDGTYVFRASESKEFMVSKEDVHDCFLLPLGPNELPLVPTGRQKGSNLPVNKELKDRWRERFGIKSANASVPIGKIKAAIEADKEGGDDFCQLFVLFCMSSFLAPTSNDGIDFKLLRAVEDVSAIPKFDWCTYVLKGIVNADEDVKKNHTHLRGCIPFLMITYFQRFDYRGAICAHDLPLIKHWDEARLKSRIKGEVADGGLGRQTWSLVRYPRCLHSATNTPVICSSIPQLLISSTPYPQPAKKFIQIELPPGVEDDEQLKDRALDDVHELYLKIQRNAIVFHSWYANAISRIKQLTTENIDQAGFVVSQWEGEELHRYCNEVEDIAVRLKKIASNAPVPKEVPSATKDTTLEDNIATLHVTEVLLGLHKGDFTVVVNESLSKAVEVGVGEDSSKLESKAPATDAGGVDLGSDEVPSTNNPICSENIIDSAVFYNTAEINEVLLLGANQARFNEQSDREIVEESGYTTAEIGKSMEFMNKEREGVSVPGDVYVGEIRGSIVSEVVVAEGNGTVTPIEVVSTVASSVGVKGELSKRTITIAPSKTPLPKAAVKRMVDDETESEVIYKRRRSSLPVLRKPRNYAAVNRPATEPLSAVSSRLRSRGNKK